MTPPLGPPAPVRTPPTILPVSKKFHLMLVAVATVAVALLPVVVMAIPPLWRPAFVRRLVVLVRPPVPEAVLRGEGAGALDVSGVEGWGWKRRVGRMGGVHGVRRVVTHRGGVHGGRHGGVRYRWRRHRWHHVWLVGVLSRNLGRWGASCRAGKRRGWKVRWGVRESLPAGGLRKRWAYRALVQSAGSLRRRRWGVLHEVRVRVHIPAVAMVTQARGYLWVVVVRGDRRLWRRRPQVGGPVAVRRHVRSWSHSRSVSSPILVERHACPQTDSAPSLPHFNTASVHKSSHKIPGSFDILNSILSKIYL